MEIENVNIVVKHSIGLSGEHEEQLFEIEKATFGSTYERCPKTIEDFRKRYDQQNLFIIMCILDNKIIAHRLFERINEYQLQSRFMVVKNNFRGLKLSNIMCAFAAQYFKWLGYKYITSWTHVDITASKILAKYASYISVEAELSEEEIKLLNNFELSANKELGFFGIKRRVPNFYKMLDNRIGDAFFWAHKL